MCQLFFFFFFQAEDGIRDGRVTGVQTCALPITPLSIAEIRADKDQLRAEFAMTTRRLEMSVDKLKAKTTSQLAELGKKTDAINQLKKELGEKTATIFALETRDKRLQIGRASCR